MLVIENRTKITTSNYSDYIDSGQKMRRSMGWTQTLFGNFTIAVKCLSIML